MIIADNLRGAMNAGSFRHYMLGQKTDRNKKLFAIIEKNEGFAYFSIDSDSLGDTRKYLIGQFAAGRSKKAVRFVLWSSSRTKL